MGTYTGTVSDAELKTITVDYTIEFARVLRASSTDAAFAFLSGAGADQTGRSRIAYARYKGEAEKALLAAGFPSVYIFRPAYIYPVEPRREPNFSYRLLRVIYPVFRALFPNQVIRADDLGRAMVDVTIRKRGEREHLVFENRDMRWTPFLRPRDAIFKLAFFEAAQVVGLCRLHRASIHFGKREQRAKQPSSPSLPVLVTSFLAPEAL